MKQQDKNPIDELFSKVAEQHQMQPSAKVWDSIRADQLGKKNTRRPLLWVLIVAALAGAVATTAYFILEPEHSNYTAITADKTEEISSGKENNKESTSEKNFTKYESQPSAKAGEEVNQEIAGRVESDNDPEIILPKKLHKTSKLSIPQENLTAEASNFLSVEKIVVEPGLIITDKPNSINHEFIQPKALTKKQELAKSDLLAVTDPSLPVSWFIAAAAGPQFRGRTLKGEDSYRPILDVRDSAESTSAGIMVQIEAGKYLTKHIYISSGLQYRQLQMNSQFRYINSQHYISSRIDTSVRMNMQNKRIEVWYDTVNTFKTTYAEYQVSSVIKYNSITLPLFLGLETTRARWQFGAKAGVGVNFLTLATGVIAGGNNSPGESLTNIPHQKINAEILMQGYLGYMISNDFTFYAGPNFSQNLFSSFKDSYPVKQYNHHYGLTAGIKKSF